MSTECFPEICVPMYKNLPSSKTIAWFRSVFLGYTWQQDGKLPTTRVCEDTTDGWIGITHVNFSNWIRQIVLLESDIILLISFKSLVSRDLIIEIDTGPRVWFYNITRGNDGCESTGGYISIEAIVKLIRKPLTLLYEKNGDSPWVY